MEFNEADTRRERVIQGWFFPPGQKRCIHNEADCFYSKNQEVSRQ